MYVISEAQKTASYKICSVYGLSLYKMPHVLEVMFAISEAQKIASYKICSVYDTSLYKMSHLTSYCHETRTKIVSYRCHGVILHSKHVS
jgi:hypothetical protein